MFKIKQISEKIINKLRKGKKMYIPLAVAFLVAVCGMYIQPDTAPATNTDGGTDVPIIMYHSVLKSAKKQTKYIVTPSQLESDMLWLKSNGYTTVLIQDLINYVYDGTPLPPKPVIITFDDGYYNNLIYLYPLLKKYNMKAVISIIGRYSEEYSKTLDLNPTYAHLTWDNIKELNSSGIVEILNHSYNMHSTDVRKGCKILSGESYFEYKTVLAEDIMKTQELLSSNCGITPAAFTYPFGYMCDESEEILKELGFKASLSCYEKINHITRDKSCLYMLKRFNRDSTLSTEKFMSKIS